MLFSLAGSFLLGDIRFLLAKGGFVTLLGGLGFLVSLRARHPLVFSFTRPLLEGRFGTDGVSWLATWETEPQFRHVWRVSTVIWGIGLILLGILRVTTAYTLPVDVVPAVGLAQYACFLVVMQVVN
nr:VC0807 family protein [Micromonospora sp. DSM 115978]